MLNQNKGQKEMIKTFFSSLEKDGRTPIPFEEIYASSLSTFKIIESIKNGGKIRKLDS